MCTMLCTTSTGCPEQDDSARARILEDRGRDRVVVQDLVEHIATAQRLARQLADAPLQAQQVEREPITEMSFTVSVDLGVRPQHMTQHRGVAAHVTQDEKTRSVDVFWHSVVREQTAFRGSDC